MLKQLVKSPPLILFILPACRHQTFAKISLTRESSVQFPPRKQAWCTWWNFRLIFISHHVPNLTPLSLNPIDHHPKDLNSLIKDKAQNML